MSFKLFKDEIVETSFVSLIEYLPSNL